MEVTDLYDGTLGGIFDVIGTAFDIGDIKLNKIGEVFYKKQKKFSLRYKHSLYAFSCGFHKEALSYLLPFPDVPHYDTFIMLSAQLRNRIGYIDKKCAIHRWSGVHNVSMKRVIVNAYACSPGMGSEPGMAWNWCVHLAKHCELHIITEGEFRERIEGIVPTLPQGKNMHFYYNPIGGDNIERCEKIRRMCWNQGDWRFYKYYRDWQWKTYLMAKEICLKEKIDILHQLNMIGFREPGYLWKLSEETGIKFVWGPVDAKDKFPLAYCEGAGFKTKLFLWMKNTITKWQLGHSSRVRKAASVASVVVSASSNSVRSFKNYMNIHSPLLNETGCSSEYRVMVQKKEKHTFDVLWVGKMDFRKQLGLALKAVATDYRADIRLHIVGGGDATSYRMQAETLGIMDLCVWYGAVSHEEVQRLMQMADVFLFTSVAEGTPHVVLEAISNHLPVLCFDTCGQGNAVNDRVGRKIPLSNPNQSIRDFAKEIDYLYSHREVLKTMSGNCRHRQLELSWDRKAEEMVKMYNESCQLKE